MKKTALPNICFDRLLPADRMLHQQTVRRAGVTSAVMPLGKLWMNGSTLRVRFMGGTAAQRDKVVTQANWWTQHANLSFVFDDSPDAEIRIAFNPDFGAWSYIGTDNASIPRDQPTMNLGFMSGGTAAHEFGHCLDGDTLIDCPRDLGKHPHGIPIRDLVGTEPWVYGWKDGQPVIRKASRVWLTKRAETVRVVLRTGQGGRRNRKYSPPLELIGTADHPVLLSDGLTWRPLGELRSGDRLCSLYRHSGGKRSRLYWTGLKMSQRPREHVFICEQVYGPRPERHDSHHINERMDDQSVENLQWKHESDHCRDHSTGRVDSEETRAKRVAANLGRRHTAETRAKLSAIKRGSTVSDAVRAKMSASKKGKPQSLELRAKRADAIRKYYASGGRSGMRGKRASEETRAKQSEALREYYRRGGRCRGKAVSAVNHVVVSVEPAGVRDVYDMTVPDANSFIANGVVVHNSLGLFHEHQNPAGGIEWNEEVVLRDLAGPPNFWNEETVRNNVLKRYAADQVRGTAFDPDSIMLYHFPATWVKSGVATKANNVLSATDKAYIGSQHAYPKTSPTTGQAVEVQVDATRRTQAAIGKYGEEDLFWFGVSNGGLHTIDTRGPTDVVMKLFGPNSETSLIAEDDDSGLATNALIRARLPPGIYFIQVRHYNRARGLGSYSVKVQRTMLA